MSLELDKIPPIPPISTKARWTLRMRPHIYWCVFERQWRYLISNTCQPRTIQDDKARQYCWRLNQTKQAHPII